MSLSILPAARLSAVLLLLSCGGSTEPEPPGSGSVAEVRIVSTVTSVMVGATAQLTAKALDSNGQELEGRTVAWSSSNTAVITVSTTGLVSAHQAGSVTVTASSGGKSATLGLVASAVPVGKVVVTAPQDTTIAGMTVQLTAVTLSAADAPLSGRAVTWATADPAIATVSATGIVSGVGPGPAIVTATSEGVSGSFTLEVLPGVASVTVVPDAVTIVEGESVELSVILKDASGDPLMGRPVTWKSETPGVASVSAEGVVTGIKAGATQITARSETAEGLANFLVEPVPVASITVRPEEATIVVGGSLTFSPSAFDATGALLEGREISLTVDPSGVLDLPGGFSVTGTGEGMATATFTSGGAAAEATIRVARPTYQSVDAGSVFTCGIGTDGIALCWGGRPDFYSGFDRLPRGIAGDPQFDLVRAGTFFSCGLAGGAVSCWGLDPLTEEVRDQPEPIPGAPSFTTIDVGQEFACGLAANGSAHCWGFNYAGQLGDGGFTNSAMPVAVSGGHTFVELAVGSLHVCGLTGTGEVYCWGGSTHSTTPRLVSGSVQFASITAGSCGLDAAGTAYCWDDTATLPVPIAEVGGPFVTLTASTHFNRCGLMAGGIAYCWGAGGQGELGTGDALSSPTPQPVAGGHTFLSISTGVNHTCGITHANQLYCWGYGGAVGSPSPLEPVTVPTLVTGQP